MPKPIALISGSVAYDYIMDYPGKFAEHILPDNIHQLSVAFLIKQQTQQFGGNAANIAYNLRLLAKQGLSRRAGRKLVQPHVIATVGDTNHNDGKAYIKRLAKLKAKTKLIHLEKHLPTAAAYIMTDQANNQITGFYSAAQDVSATKQPKLAKRLHKLLPQVKLAIIAPGNTTDMAALAKLYVAQDIPYIADPGQQITSLTTVQLKAVVSGASVLTVNDYELALILKSLGITLPELRKVVPLVIVTYGAKGAKWYRGRKVQSFGVAKVKKVIDPTGAGDAYRAGVMAGLLHEWDDATTAQVAALLATYTIESHGTQEHFFIRADFSARYKRAFRKPFEI